MKEETRKYVEKITSFEAQFIEKGYEYLGWQLGLQNERYKKCYEAGHMGGKPEGKKDIKTVVKDESFSNRGSHHTYWCDECKIWWNIDMSD